MGSYETAISIQNVTKKYDGFTLKDISFAVPKGSIMGFIGQNGAGKTTTIRALLNLIPIDGGSISIFGLDHCKDETAIKRRIAAVFDEIPFHEVFNAKQIDAVMHDIYDTWSHETFQSYLERFALPERKKIGQFSKGMKMKLQIAVALSHNAELLVMDEATTGLDPVVRSEILDIFLEYLQDEGHSILMSSHITSDLEKIADSVTFIDRGKLLVSGYKDDILQSHAILKCGKADYKGIDPQDYISARTTDFGVELLVADRAACAKKYHGLAMDAATLDDIMVFYVHGEKKEWSSCEEKG